MSENCDKGEEERARRLAHKWKQRCSYHPVESAASWMSTITFVQIHVSLQFREYQIGGS